ncbi:hypothetical protein MHBO_005073 [Bonamia ostreae]|uniref:Uncharacterized protein n=1 Tax=Bonamia ostreae TaxID=126728 RepID=A0ABV2AVX7_9EUKA
MGLSVPPHEASHRYRVIEPIKTPLFEIEWTADEELLLLEGIQLYGFGNWADVAEHVGSKSKYRCETHFSKKYLESKNAPFPETILDENSKILNKREKGEDVRKFLEQIKKFKSVSFPSLKISNPGKPKLLSKSEMHPSMLSVSLYPHF